MEPTDRYMSLFVDENRDISRRGLWLARAGVVVGLLGGGSTGIGASSTADLLGAVMSAAVGALLLGYVVAYVLSTPADE